MEFSSDDDLVRAVIQGADPMKPRTRNSHGLRSLPGLMETDVHASLFSEFVRSNRAKVESVVAGNLPRVRL